MELHLEMIQDDDEIFRVRNKTRLIEEGYLMVETQNMSEQTSSKISNSSSLVFSLPTSLLKSSSISNIPVFIPLLISLLLNK